jgi:hypothetical protein
MAGGEFAARAEGASGPGRGEDYALEAATWIDPTFSGRLLLP